MLKPNDFARDWYGFVTNQAGHAYLIGFPLVYAWMFWLDPISAVLATFISYLLIWEGGVQRFSMPRDAIEDAAHVTAGAAVAVTMFGYTNWWLWPYTIQAVFLAVGAASRAKRRGRERAAQEGRS